MYGAILGDIIGSPYEFDEENKSKEIDLFRPEAHFTDDTVMTAAVADALLKAGPNAGTEQIRENVVLSMRAWGQKYPDAGYGGGFRRWLNSREPKPYRSYGNGSARRVSPAGWPYESLDKTDSEFKSISFTIIFENFGLDKGIHYTHVSLSPFC